MTKRTGDSVATEVVIKKIHTVRGQKIMLDVDLAALYRVETKRLNEAVRRNRDRFPNDFMFQLTEKEWKNLRSQTATSKERRGGRRYLPFAFTEHGVLMLSSVLNSSRAIQVNIQIMRIYTRLREIVNNHTDVLLKLEQLERKFKKHDKNFEIIFAYLNELMNPKAPAMRTIGFRQRGR